MLKTELMNLWLWIGLGGFIGALLRFAASGLMQSKSAVFPLGTLGINVIGSFFMGFIMYSSEFGGLFSEEARIFLTIGILGSFTTMSTFSYETFKLLEQNELLLVSINIIGTVLLTVFAIYLGKIAALNLWKV
ncbi:MULTISPECIES: fluoride efflux transporter CrcB [Methanobacterium]|jgi:CrcB protein|uniref:Fluoride-specific ion channel FluC n=1 Tax=Methanobacterium veterum TaxID=408577 RepID=A0A9E4ZXU9_9EURY|nr:MULTISPECIES: fluoride efflux transporter CrcB [Methanobacterium]MCZ3366003.1 fluoride efflux transporter CrcB [Methanobacterium veterum]MCZ3371468.1 fluoride efflux transporter CrcB [Methanobacterium veterum]